MLVGEQYIKIHSSGLYLELILYSLINDENDNGDEGPFVSGSKTNMIELKLRKIESVWWPQLEAVISKENKKSLLLEHRKRCLEKLTRKEQEKAEKRREKKIEEEKRLLNLHWEMQKKEKEELEKLKQEEIETARREVYQMKSKIENDQNCAIQTAGSSKEVFKDCEIKHHRNFDKHEKDGEHQGIRVLPPVRETSTIKVTFTPRTMRTAAREDKDSETLKKYELWKSIKQPSLDETAIWMKEKGDNFFKKGNLQAAVNAYSESIEKENNTLSVLCYANRSACYLKLKNYAMAIQDCNKIITDQNLKNSLHLGEEKSVDIILGKTYLRRGTSHYYLGSINTALDDYKKAMQLMKDLSQTSEYRDLIHDLEMLEKRLQIGIEENNPQSYKILGDRSYLKGDISEAENFYTKAIHFDLLNFTAISNRAACYLKERRYAECVKDCSFVIENIYKCPKTEDPAASENGMVKNAAQLMLKCLLRRGAANCMIGNIKKALDDYESAHRMMPEDKNIIHDLDAMSKLVETNVTGEWLKNRGNYFYSLRDYASAIQAYTIAIENENNNIVYYANRAQCYLQLREYIKCIHDCNVALSTVSGEDFMKLMREMEGGNDVQVDKIPINVHLTQKLQTKIYVRRGTAYKELEEMEKAKSDFKKAVTLDPSLTNKFIEYLRE